MSPNGTRYLTKSKFKMALECPTKLFYADHKADYFDKNQDNDFLQSLADGGHQIGELAKFKYHPSPIAEHITIETLGYEESLAQTNHRLNTGERVVVAEAAVKSGVFFIRVDILIFDRLKKTIEVIEVKSKSIKEQTVQNGFLNSKGNYETEWLPYLYDITFQAEVVSRCFPDFQVIPKLLLVDAREPCDVDGLHQRFPIVTDLAGGRKRIRVNCSPTLSAGELGSLSFLREINVSAVVSDLRLRPINNPAHIPVSASQSMLSFMDWMGATYEKGERFFHGISKTCSTCQFRATDQEPLRSGVHECWNLALQSGLIHGARTASERTSPLSIDIWGGGAGAKSFAQDVLNAGRAYLSDVQADDIRPKAEKHAIGLSPFERRMAQIEAVSGSGSAYVLSEDALAAMDEWSWPLHMIDFETSAPALPFFKGMRPYQTLAFQFSHHIMDRSESGEVHVRHANQWISTQPGEFPNVEFVRQLRNALMPSGQLVGTVFRYHNHENTVLRSLRKLILASPLELVPDATDLLEFIDLITKSTKDETETDGEFLGARPMVDLHRLVQDGYYSKHAGGSISLKYILPAILNDAPKVRDFYARPGVYGKSLIVESLNFDDPNGHIWIDPSKQSDPYKTLPPIFENDRDGLNQMLLRLAGDDEEEGVIAQGGLAMTAYNYTQFTELAPQERASVENALLRYCELDTLAMVMLVQGLMELRGKPMCIGIGKQNRK